MSHYNRPLLYRKFIEFVIWPIEAVFAAILVGLMRCLPITFSSDLFGWLAAKIGPKTKYHKRSLAHIRYAMPHLTPAEQEAEIHKMWNHLGRVAGEFVHLHKMGNDRYLTFHGLEHLEAATDGGLILSGHIGNWELSVMTSKMLGHHYGLIYRPLNNPLANWVLDMRHLRGNPDCYAKGQDAARGMLTTLRKKGFIYLFVDQKYRQGLMSPFLGKPAMTPIGHIKLAMKQDVPLFFMRVIRREGPHYDVYIEPPFRLYHNGPITDEAIAEAALMINDKLSSWITETPSQWLWPHRRWGKDI